MKVLSLVDRHFVLWVVLVFFFGIELSFLVRVADFSECSEKRVGLILISEFDSNVGLFAAWEFYFFVGDLKILEPVFEVLREIIIVFDFFIEV